MWPALQYIIGSGRCCISDAGTPNAFQGPFGSQFSYGSRSAKVVSRVEAKTQIKSARVERNCRKGALDHHYKNHGLGLDADVTVGLQPHDSSRSRPYGSASVPAPSFTNLCSLGGPGTELNCEPNGPLGEVETASDNRRALYRHYIPLTHQFSCLYRTSGFDTSRLEVTMDPSVSSAVEPIGLFKRKAAQRITILSPTEPGLSPKRTLVWKGDVKDLLGFDAEHIDSSEAWWLNRIHPDDLFDVVSSLSKILAPAPERPYASDARIWSHDFRFKHANGHYLLVSERSIVDRDGDGNVLSMTSTIFDAEKRRIERKAHREFLDSRNQFALIANNTPSGIWMMDPQGYTTYLNQAAEQITGFKFEEIAGWTFHAAVHSCRADGSPYPVDECPIFRHQQQGTEAKNQSEVFVHKLGHHYDIEYSVSPIGDYASGGAVIEFRDVTFQKKLEKERLAAIVQNEQQSVLIKASEDHKANMASFVSFVCHELRNPLQGITSSTEFLSETLGKLESLTNNLHTNSPAINDSPNGISKGISPETNGNSIHSSETVDTSTVETIRGLVTYAQELVSNVVTCASHQALITNNVLDLSRLDAGKVEPSYELVDLRALSKEAVGMMASRARVKSIDLRLANDDASPLYLKADSTLMSQIFLNLIGNAVKFTSDNGEIVVNIHSEPPDANGRVVFHGSVSDDGVGMTEAEQQRLFKRFSQANKRVAQTYKGSGLGLSISKEIVKVLGGDMTVQSAPGVGSTFSFTSMHDCPTKDELAAFLKSGTSTVAVATDLEKFAIGNAAIEPPPKFKKICVAEDNLINLQILAKNLDALGYDYVLCNNGKEALENFVKPGSDTDCVILDMSMPVMDGLEATRLMREYEASAGSTNPRRIRTPIVALSGNAMKEQIEEAFAAGTSDYVVKPCKRAQLKLMINHWERIVHEGADHTPLIVK